MSTETDAPSRESLKDWVASTPKPTGEPTPDPEPEETLYWDLRPKGDPGHLISAGGREVARLRNLEEVGAIIWTDEAIEGSGTVVIQRPGMIIESHVVASEAIPVAEMAPHQKGLEGVVTPLWPIGKSDWLRDPSKIPADE